jgi:hypothetical protein
MNNRFKRWPHLVVAMLLSTGLISGCTNYAQKIDPATAEREMRQAVSVPEGRALLMVYSTRAKPGRPLIYRIIRGFPAVISERYYQIGFGKPDAIYLLPGRYTLIAGDQGLNPHPIEINLAAGEIQVLRHTSDRPPYLEPVHQDALFTDRELRGSAPELRRVDEKQVLTQRRVFLNADEIETHAEDFCIQGIARARWANAQLESRFENCAPISGTFSYDDGTTLSASFEVIGGIGIMFSQQYGVLHIENAYAGMPAALAGIRDSEQIVAVDHIVLNRLQNAAEAIAALRGPPGSTVRVQVSPLFVPQQARVVDIVRAPIPGMFEMKPASPAHLRHADGSRFRGTVELDHGEALVQPGKTTVGSTPSSQRHGLPLPRPVGIGQLMQPDGHGFLGPFENGLAHGQGYCFTATGGRACRYQEGVRVSDSGVATRDARSVLSSVGNLPPEAAVDMLRQRWIQALMEERWSDFLDRQADLHAVGFDTGDESLFFEARALNATGQPEAAMERLVAYLNLVGSAGASYPDALALYPVLEAPAAAAREARLAALRTAREARMAYCEIDAQTERPACGCHEFAAELPGIARRACDDGA